MAGLLNVKEILKNQSVVSWLADTLAKLEIQSVPTYNVQQLSNGSHLCVFTLSHYGISSGTGNTEKSSKANALCDFLLTGGGQLLARQRLACESRGDFLSEETTGRILSDHETHERFLLIAQKAAGQLLKEQSPTRRIDLRERLQEIGSKLGNLLLEFAGKLSEEDC